MSNIIHKAKDALSVSKGSGMSGIGADQSSLASTDDASKVSVSKYEEKYGTPDDAAVNKLRAMETGNAQAPTEDGAGDASGGYGRDMSGIGADQSVLGGDQSQVSVENYERKYGRPDEAAVQNLSSVAGRDMSGMGTDQSALSSTDDQHKVSLTGYEEQYGKPSEEAVRKVEGMERE